MQIPQSPPAASARGAPPPETTESQTCSAWQSAACRLARVLPANARARGCRLARERRRAARCPVCAAWRVSSAQGAIAGRRRVLRVRKCKKCGDISRRTSPRACWHGSLSLRHRNTAVAWRWQHLNRGARRVQMADDARHRGTAHTTVKLMRMLELTDYVRVAACAPSVSSLPRLGRGAKVEGRFLPHQPRGSFAHTHLAQARCQARRCTRAAQGCQ